ncbi:MAG: GntR family transcriptional regulator, N-acetylglucosamine utilization regulator [Candidatus Atribacteria bacterium]|nr:GntR family transcriptional regulator, N-acetylglucosamine utilization regulator [Candidatus Atribacteria bacterium]
MRVSRNSAIPLYYQIERDLLELIEKGNWKAGEMVPTEKELQETYQVSRTTVRQALNSLVQKGLLIRIPGRGTFVAKNKISHNIGTITSFTEEMLARGIKPGTKILQFERIVPPKLVANDLEISEDNRVILLKRLRFADGEPVAINETYLPEDLIPGFSEDEIGDGSLYRFLEDKYGLIFRETRETVDAILITEEESDLLQVPEGSPGLLVGRISYIQTGRAIERAYTIYRGDKFTYHARLVGRDQGIGIESSSIN